MLANIIEPSAKSPLSIPRITRLVHGPEQSPWRLEGLETLSLQLENLERLPHIVEAPELHLEEMRSAYILMELEARRIAELTAMFIGQCGDLTVESPPELLKAYFAHDAVNMVLLSLALILNKLLRLAGPDDGELQSDAAFLTKECLAAADRSNRFRPLGCSMGPLCLAVVQATGGEVPLWDGPLMDKFIKLGSVLEAKFRSVEAQFAGEVVSEQPDAACCVM